MKTLWNGFIYSKCNCRKLLLNFSCLGQLHLQASTESLPGTRQWIHLSAYCRWLLHGRHTSTCVWRPTEDQLVGGSCKAFSPNVTDTIAEVSRSQTNVIQSLNNPVLRRPRLTARLTRAAAVEHHGPFCMLFASGRLGDGILSRESRTQLNLIREGVSLPFHFSFCSWHSVALKDFPWTHTP